MTSVSDLIVTDNLTTNTLHVSGLSRFSNDIYTEGEIIVNSNATIRGSINTSSSLNVSGTSILRGNILALSGLNINGVSNFQNNVNVLGNLNVTGHATLHSLQLGSIPNVEAAINNMSMTSDYYNKTEVSNLLSGYYNMTGTNHLFVPIFNLSGATPIGINNSLNVNGILSVGGIMNIEQAINNKLNISEINNYYNKTEINNMNYINMITASSTFAPISSTSNDPYNDERMSFNMIDLNQSNILTASMFVNNYIRITNNNTSTLVLPSVPEIIYGLFNGNVLVGTTFPTYISHNLGSLQSLYVQPNNINPSFKTYISFEFDEYNTDTTLLIGAPGYSRNKYSHHLVTRIDSMTSMTVFKL